MNNYDDIVKDLIVFIAHIDDFECACYGYVFKHHKEYDKIKIVTATTWAKKLPVWEENLKLFPISPFVVFA